MWGFLLKIPEWSMALWSVFNPPIAIEMHRRRFQDIHNGQTDPVVVITAHPRRFICELSMTNKRKVAIYVKDVRLHVGDLTILEPRETRNLCLAPFERKTIKIIFPVEGTRAIVNFSSFLLTITPTVGRQSKATGQIPLGDD